MTSKALKPPKKPAHGTCERCGQGFERKPGAGRPRKYCHGCQAENGGNLGRPEDAGAIDQASASMRSKAKQRLLKRHAREASAREHQRLLVRLAGALSVVEDPEVAAQWAGLSKMPAQQLQGLVEEARRHHGDLADPQNLDGLVRRIRVAIARIADAVVENTDLIPPGSLGVNLSALARAAESLRGDGGGAVPYSNIEVAVVGQDGQPLEVANA